MNSNPSIHAINKKISKVCNKVVMIWKMLKFLYAQYSEVR